MNLKHRKITTALTLLLVLAVLQVYVGVTFAEPSSGPKVSGSEPQALMGILTTHNNKPITVNGASAVSGATIPTGATIETPDQVGATIRIASLGTLCIAPNTKVILEFDKQGNVGTVKVTIVTGCAILSTLKDTTGTITTGQGTAGQTNSATGGTIDVCSRAGAAPLVNQGAAADAGAGSSALDCGAAGAAAVPTGIPIGATIAMLAGGAAGIYVLFRPGNPSPSGP
jgi:hypothetical protein